MLNVIWKHFGLEQFPVLAGLAGLLPVSVHNSKRLVNPSWGPYQYEDLDSSYAQEIKLKA